MVQLNANTTFLLRCSGRIIQCVCSLLALATIAGGFRHQDSLGLSSMLGSHTTNFALLMVYTTMLYSLFALVAIEHFKCIPRLPLKIDMMMDGAFAALMLITGICLAASDYVAHCDSYGIMLRCGSLKAGTAFTFFVAFAFLFNAALAFMTQSNGSEEMNPMPPNEGYVVESTPTNGAMSPMGMNMTTPASKV